MIKERQKLGRARQAKTPSLGLIVGLSVSWLLAGCAFGGGAGIALSVDTRGAVAVLATTHVHTWGARVNAKTTPRYEGAFVLMPAQVAGGYQFNPNAGLLRVDMPGMGFTADDVDQEHHGFAGSLHPRADITWPQGGDGARLAMGLSANMAWLPHLKTTQLKRLGSRPEWPDGWEFHQLGPSVDIAAMADEDGEVYGSLSLGARYQHLTYFYLGL